MCRHLAYVGPPIAVSEPLLDASHALVRQAQNPRYQLSGEDNPDGFGVVWYERGTAHPWRYRTTMPMWLQPGLANAFVGVHAHALVAAARLASPGLPIDVANNAPFVSGHWSFSLNGQFATSIACIYSPRQRGQSCNRSILFSACSIQTPPKHPSNGGRGMSRVRCNQYSRAY